MINNLTDLDPFLKKDYSRKSFKLWEEPKLYLGYYLPYSSFEVLFNNDLDATLNSRCHCCGKELFYFPWILGPHDTLCTECASQLEERFGSKSFPWVFEKEDDTAKLLDYFYTFL